MRSENEFLALIDRHFPSRHPRLALGRGDDAAVVRVPGEICVTSDLFLEDVHFRRRYFAPGDVGWKALAVNLSDVAAMGARPLAFTLGLTAPRDVADGWWEALFAAMGALAREADCPLAGGDLSLGAGIGLAITVFGEAPAGGRFLRRTQSRVGDVLFCLGPVGLARAGLRHLEVDGDPARWPRLVAAHLRPGLHLAQALTLAQEPAVRGLMDVSDGLAMDLPRFLGAEVGAEVSLPPNALHPELLAWCQEQGQAPAEFALAGGEDYALLGACNPAAWAGLTARVEGVWRLGQVTAAPTLRLNGQPLRVTGYDHFA